jgi:hypothetical protein
MDSETRLVATPEQAAALIAALTAAKQKAAATDEPAWVDLVLEQVTHRGPWRLVIGVLPPHAPHTPEPQ